MILNRLKKFFVVTLIATFFTNNFAFSQSTDKSNLLGQINTITTAVPFLMISPDARAGGMGDAGVASSPDVNSIHWNPAKMTFNEKKIGIGISYTPWLRALVPDINLAYVSAFSKLGDGNQALSGSLRFFSLGNIDFTDVDGNNIGQFNPSEFSIDGSYSRKLGENFSGGVSLRYIHSNLTGGIAVPGSNTQTKAGNSVAADVSGYFQKEIELSGKDAVFSAGFNISNIGSKITYSETGTKDFIPINLRIGPALKIKLNEYNDLAFMVDFNKLLVPTPPVFSDSVVDGEYLILAGKDPDVGVPQGIFQSFGDAPGGGKEELREINICGGMEYWYDKQFAFRAGYFYEHATKGNRKYFTLGAGLRYNVFGLDFAYLIPTEQRNPLENTLRFTLSFDFEALSGGADDGGE
jgi:hypothetical protein